MDTWRVLNYMYGVHAPSVETVRKWYRKFKKNDFDLDDKPRGVRPKNYESAMIKEQMRANPKWTAEQIGKKVRTSEATVMRHLNAFGYHYENGEWKVSKVKKR